MGGEKIQLDIGQFVELKKQELNLDSSDDLIKLEICSKSIFYWIQYFEYHYFTLIGAVTGKDLICDKYMQIRRAGEPVKLRFLHGANSAACLQCLHALLDSFPYLLNLFIPMFESSESTRIKWSGDFIKKYSGCSFYNNLKSFMCEVRFNQIKGYVNRIKHKHLVMVENDGVNLKFEDFLYKQCIENDVWEFSYQHEELRGQDVIIFLEECYDDLIPKFFNLCDSVISYKKQQLGGAS